jgi:hypothetical protein
MPMTIPAPGDRVRLVFTTDPHTRLKAGDKGTVSVVHRVGATWQIHVRWDSGSTLSLVSDEDMWEIV